MKATLLVSLVCVMTAAWGWMPPHSQAPRPRNPPVEPEPPPPDQVPVPPTVEADPEKLLARIEALEQRLAQAERQLATLQTHTHEYSAPTFDTTVTYDQLLKSPEQYKKALVSLRFGTAPNAPRRTSPPKP